MPFTVSSDGLPSVALRRVEPERNVARFYELALARDLFGQVVLVREWGRIGTFGRRRQDEYASESWRLNVDMLKSSPGLPATFADWQ